MTLFFPKIPAGRKPQVTWLVLALFILSAEALFRSVEINLSGNIAHLKSLNNSFEELGHSQPPRTAFIGNSLVNEGISPSILEANSRQTMIKAVPDGTAFWDWQCIVDQFVLSKDPAPVENLVIGFAWNQLSDQAPLNPSRLGGYICQHNRLFEPASVGLRNFEDMAEFAAAAALKLYANRETIRNRFLDLVIPKYRKYAQEANRAAPQNNNGSPSSSAANHDHLEQLIDKLKQKNINPIFIAMPVKYSYQINNGLRETLRELKVPLLDYRSLAGIKHDSFSDDIHLNQSGRRLLTQKLAADLIPLLKD